MTPEQEAAAQGLLEAWNCEEFTWKPDDFDPANIVIRFDGDGLLPGVGYQEYRIFADGEVDG